MQCNQNKKYKTGLVLSGGGVRGFAHLGALKALNEAGNVKTTYNYADIATMQSEVEKSYKLAQTDKDNADKGLTTATSELAKTTPSDSVSLKKLESIGIIATLLFRMIFNPTESTLDEIIFEESGTKNHSGRTIFRLLILFRSEKVLCISQFTKKAARTG